MSTVKTNAIIDASGGNTATINSMTPTADSLQGFRNRIINGDMRIDQRNAGASVTPSTVGSHQYLLDRWFVLNTPGSKYSVQQNAGSVTPPTGFSNYLGCTSVSAYSIGVSEYQFVGQKIEGFNFADLMWGTANAKTVTLSFWVRSSLTGTFGGFLRNSANNRFYPFSYTINAANTWEYETITIVGDTTGTWVGATNGTGLDLNFSIATGSNFTGTAGAWTASTILAPTGQVSVVGTNGATWYITGVQLEVGSVATPFERRPYGTELQLCQRYYYRLTSTGENYPFGVAQCTATTSAVGLTPYPVTMRTAPSALEQSGTAADYRLYVAGGSVQACSAVPAYAGVLTTTAYGAVNFTVTANIVAGNVTLPHAANSSAYLGWSAEL